MKLKRIAICVALAATLIPAAQAAEPLMLEDVVVTAPRSEEPLTVRTNPRAPRQPLPAHDGADYLKTIPGFSVIRKGGTDGDPVLRGMSGSRLNILLNGEVILGGCGGRMDPPTAYVFPEAYDEIEVLKGPQSVRYGASTAGRPAPTTGPIPPGSSTSTARSIRWARTCACTATTRWS